jgi:hypothetical protein
MNERETKNEYKVIQQESKFDPYVANIERLKSSLTPKQNMELKTILVGASKHDGSFQKSALKLLDKKINQIESSMSKEGVASRENINRLAANVKIQRSQSLRPRTLRNKFNRTRRTNRPTMSPIQEGSRESSRSASPRSSKSTWRSSKSEPKTKKWFFGLF